MSPTAKHRSGHLVGFVAVLSIAGSAQGQWTVISLNPPGVSSRAYAIDGYQQFGSVQMSGSLLTATWNANPMGWTTVGAGEIFASHQGQRVGRINCCFQPHAALWDGPAGTFINLHPVGTVAEHSSALDVHAGQQVGYIQVFGKKRAYLWTGSAASRVNLQPSWALHSVALGVWDGIQVGWAADASLVPRAGMWSGTAQSWMDFHPAGTGGSLAYGIHGSQQVGIVKIGDHYQAGLWTGTPESWVNLHPPGAQESWGLAVHSGIQVGFVGIGGGARRASLWRGTPGSWEDLSSYLSGSWGNTYAHDVWNDGVHIFVAGYGYNNVTGGYEALLWKSPIGCYANCDASTVAPVLNVADFACFLQRFAAGEPYANCDQSTTEPVLNVADFACFLQKFAAGCE
jgi:hypothetical protein